MLVQGCYYCYMEVATRLWQGCYYCYMELTRLSGGCYHQVVTTFVECCLATKSLNLNKHKVEWLEWLEVIMGVALGC